jgi:nucleoid-associated protein EbfC
VQPNGEYDFRALVEQSERLQRQMMEAQLAMAEAEVVGRAGDQVSVTLAATGEPKAVRIDEAAAGGEVDRLERLVLTALTDAHNQLRRTAENMLAPIGQLFDRMP